MSAARSFKAAFSPARLARAALLLGQGLDLAQVADRLQVGPRQLRTELARLGIEPGRGDLRERDPAVTVRVELTERQARTLRRAGFSRDLYPWAIAPRLVRAALDGGEALVDAILDDGGRR